MKARSITAAIILLLACAHVVTAEPLGTAFNYHGFLTEGGLRANGSYDLKLTLHDAATGGNTVAGPITNSAVVVSNGLFTATLDFGENVFTGEARWLKMGVRPTGSTDDFTPLSPRQLLMPMPYALYSPSAGTAVMAQSADAGAIDSVSIAGGAVTSEKIADATITSADLCEAVALNTFWRLDGNADTVPGTHFLGTTDNKPLDLVVNNQRALRLETYANSLNLIGGHSSNSIGTGTEGAVIGGGGRSGGSNVIGEDSDYSRVGGGYGNSVSSNSHSATLSGGYLNDIGFDSDHSTIGGGRENTIAAQSGYATIAGGWLNDIGADSDRSTVGGGRENKISSNSWYAAVSGGVWNDIGTDADASTIGGGQDNNIADDANHATIAGGYLGDIGVNSYASTIGGGNNNDIEAESGFATIAGGRGNIVGTNTDYSVISGGYTNRVAAEAMAAGISGGWANSIGANADYGTIGGGRDNEVALNGYFATIPGGYDNFAADYAFAAGRRAKANHTGAFVWADSTDEDFPSTADNQFLIRATGGVGINTTNPMAALDVAGTVRATALELTSPTVISNFNADLLDGRDASDFAESNHVHQGTANRIAMFGDTGVLESTGLYTSGGTIGIGVSTLPASLGIRMPSPLSPGYPAPIPGIVIQGAILNNENALTIQDNAGNPRFSVSSLGALEVAATNDNVGVLATAVVHGVQGVHGATGNSGYLGGNYFGVGGSNATSTAVGYLGGLVAAVRGKAGPSSYAGWFDGDVVIHGATSIRGTTTIHGNVHIMDTSTNLLVSLGEGLDYAEGFNVAEDAKLSPGSVVSIDPANPGHLRLSSGCYDRKVAGIVAGAKGLGSGVRLGCGQYDCDVALAGRVYCNVDARETPIEPGDLLTTSSVPGYAMKVKNHSKAQGAILGKAMEPLTKGQRGQILVLVTLQ